MRIQLFRNPGFFWPLAVLAVILSSSISIAATFTATKTADTNGTCNSGVDCSLREAINAANDEGNHPGADTIVFAAGVTGTINLSTALPPISTSVTLQGPGANLLEVTRTSGVFRIFQVGISGQPGATVTISGLAITNGHSVYDSSDATSGVGGGIVNVNATLTVSNCIINDNTATAPTLQASGGGIGNFLSGNLTVDGCSFSGNSANFGGAIYNVKSLVLKNSTLSGNSADIGGGLNTGGAGNPAVVSNCTFLNNTATSEGGGAANFNGNLTVSNCTFDHNSSNSTGGGIYNEGRNDTFVANATVSNSTLNANTAPTGGGVYNTGTSGGNAFVQLNNTILQTGSNGANLTNVGSGTSISSQGYNLSSDDGGGFLTAAGDQINTDPKLGPLQDNGGPTLTRALLVGSPAQDKGKSFGVTTDQRGFLRPVDIASIPNANGGDGGDIGAVEMDTPQTGPTFVVTTTADHDDGSCSVGDCTLREAINVSNSDSVANSITFNSGVTGTITLQSALAAITDSVTITGPGPRLLAVSGNSAIRVFSFSSGTSTMSGLTIRDGNTTTVTSGNGALGGGVFNAQTAILTLSDCTLANNHVQGGSNTTVASGAGGFGYGGAIGNSGSLTVSNCTLVGNSALGGFGADASSAMGANIHGGDGGAALGAAIFNDTTGTLTITDSTVAGNTATGGAAGKGQFGGNGGAATAGVFNNGTMTVTAATLNGNAAAGGAAGKGSTTQGNGSIGVARGGLAAGSGTSVVRDTISAGNLGNGSVGSDAGGTFSSQGYNLIGAGDASTGFNPPGDQIGTSAAPVIAQLGPLQNNGGNTDTCALSSNSPAIDKGKAFGLALDQRGGPRVVGVANAPGGDGSDIGAFEVQTTPPPTPTPTATPTPTPGSLGNVSTRLQVGTGNNVLFAGFIIQGSRPKIVLIRSAGPSLTQFGVPGALGDPQLELHDANNTIGTNDNWQTTQIGGVVTFQQAAAIQNSGAAPLNPAEPAIIAELPAGAYTAIVQGVGGTEGVATVEVYDLSPNNGSILANISTRGFIQTGDNVMIGGFIVVGNSSKVFIRATGPSLIQFGINNALANPRLELHDVNGTLAANDDWQTTQMGGIITSDQSAAIQNSGFAPSKAAESAIIATLAPGNYTAIAQGVNGGTGVGLIEVFALP